MFVAMEPPLRVVVASWNHLLKLAPADLTAEPVEADLTYLTARGYQRHKYVRRGSGDFDTPESAMNTPIIVFAGLLATGYFFLIQRDYALRKMKAKQALPSDD
jgi:hypothetical protein